MPGEAEAARAPILRSRPLAALFTAEVLSTTGSQMTWLALPWFVLVTTGSAKQMTLVIAAEAGGYAVFGIPSGSLLERLGPQRTMRLCDAVRAPLMLLVPVLHWTGELTLPILLALTFVLGSASSSRRSSTRTRLRSSARTQCSRVRRGSRCCAGLQSAASSSPLSGRRSCSSSMPRAMSWPSCS
jgi:MFS family permease